jgi:hypothetical protein
MDSSPVLVAHGLLPSSIFEAGPTSGQFIKSANGVDVPFEKLQPVQGFSAMLHLGGTRYLVMTDNGYGGKKDSPDHVLRLFEIELGFQNEGEEVMISRSIALRDPDLKVGFPIVADMEFSPDGEGRIRVDPAIHDERLLTGSDFDIESFRMAADGTLWIGDEFGPFLIHVDSEGRLLDAPVPLPKVQSPDNPFLGDSEPTLGGSSGFEGMALSWDGTRLYPMLEHHVVGDSERQLRIYEFDPMKGGYVSDQPIRLYQLDSPEHGTTEFTAITDSKFLVIERDGKQGPEADFKRVFLVDFNAVDGDGHLVKKEVLDLLEISDPLDRGGLGKTFTFPFVTTEALAVVDEQTIAVCNDNNYPFSVGRHVDQGLPDDNEFILIQFAVPVAEIEVQ